MSRQINASSATVIPWGDINLMINEEAVYEKYKEHVNNRLIASQEFVETRQ